jgi:hypothetical protein
MRPVYERVQHILVAQYALDSYGYLADRARLDTHVSCNRLGQAAALKDKIVERLRTQSAAYASAASVGPGDDTTLVFDVDALSTEAVRYDAIARVLESQSLDDIRAQLIGAGDTEGGARRRRPTRPPLGDS